MSTEPTDDCEPLPIHRQTLIKLQRPTVTSSHAQELDHLLFAGLPGHRVDRLPERVNDFAAPGVRNLLRRVVSFSGWWSPMVVG